MGAFPSATDGPASFSFFPYIILLLLLLLLPTNLSKNIFSAHFSFYAGLLSSFACSTANV
jgi:hypothetical protein